MNGFFQSIGNFFNGVWNVVSFPVTIFNFILLNWIGLLVGLGVALVLILAIWIISKHQPNIIISIILILVGGIGGMFINNMFQPASIDEVATPEERLADISANSSKYWGNTNGGFTIEQIKQAKKDNECPIYDDISISINMSDMGDYVCFWDKRESIVGNDITVINAMFLKTDNGLVYDGLLKYSCEYELVRPWYSWLTFGQYKGWYNLDNFTWHYDNENYPAYKEWGRGSGLQSGLNLAGICNNLVVASDGKLTYSRNNFDSNIDNYLQAYTNSYTNAQDFIGQNTKKFIRFGSAELIGASNEAYKKINSYYTYLWNTYLSSEDKNVVRNIDVSDYMCVVIPENDRVNYPVSAEFKNMFPDIDYYGVYKCDIAVTLSISDCGKIGSNESTKAYIKQNKDNEKLKVDEYEVKDVALSRLYVRFVDNNDSDLSTLDLEKNPVIINFKNDTTNKDLIIDSKYELFDFLYKKFVLLPSNQTYTYTIQSNHLIFDSFSGTIDLGDVNSTITFRYSYLNNNVVTGIYLNPIGTIDETLIDLSIDPVKIILSNDTKSYVFDFDSNDKLNSKIYQLVELGDYTFTILSTKLVFAQTTGKLTISADKNLMGFNYALTQDSSPLTFKTTITTNSLSSGNNIKLYSEETNVLNIRDTLFGNKSYNVYITIYSKDGLIVEQFMHTHYSTGNCVDSWLSSKLEAGVEYIAQLRFSDTNDSTITYLSDTTTFVYESNTLFTFNYTATKNV